MHICILVQQIVEWHVQMIDLKKQFDLTLTNPNALMTSRTFYLGIDATADSLHAGHLLGLKVAQTLIIEGHKCIILLGGGTTQIGDPSFKNATRPMLTVNEIEKNLYKLTRQITQLLPESIIINNIDWLENLTIIDFMRDVMSCFSTNQIIKLETFDMRLQNNQHLSMMELMYPMLQSYDFYHLCKKYNCELQIGGSDQWGNITQGIDFIKKKFSKEVYGVVFPLLTTANNKKMGKTEKGTIWLDPEKCSVYDFWQYWRNIPDSDVCKLCRYFNSSEKAHESNINIQKVELANVITSWVHGEKATLHAYEQAQKLFTYNDWTSVAIHSYPINSKLVDVLRQTLSMSSTQIKTLIKQGGIYVDDIKITEVRYIFTSIGIYRIKQNKNRFKIDIN